MSQNVPVAETSACRTGFRVCAAAATMGAEPRPDSLENSPRATPYRAAISTVVPAKPPAAAVGLKALATINSIAGQSRERFPRRIATHPPT